MRGFTLIEVTLSLVLMAILLLGIGRIVSFSSEIYLDVRERNQLLTQSRFVVERLKRELANAVPNSTRVLRDNSLDFECVEFLPIVSSGRYLDLPIVPDAVSNTGEGFVPQDYSCSSCGDFFIVYPTDASQLYASVTTDGGRRQELADMTTSGNEANFTFDTNVRFGLESPRRRFYITDSPVSFCLLNGQIRRYAGYGYNATQSLPALANSVLMAESVNLDFSAGALSVFTLFSGAGLNASRLVGQLAFARQSALESLTPEPLVFNLEVVIGNAP